MSNAPLIVRADANAMIGAGHQMRTLALAERFIAGGGRALLVASSMLPFTRMAWQRAGAVIIERHDASVALQEIALLEAAKWVVLDGYELGTSVEQLQSAGLCTLVFDDFGTTPAASLVLNAAPLRSTPRARHLLGPRYATVRANVTAVRLRRQTSNGAPRVAIIAGATDPKGVGPRLVAAARARGAEVLAPIARAEGYEARAAALVAAGARVVEDADIPTLLAEIDIAVAAAGSTAFELCAAGVAAGLVLTAENQRGVYETLVARRAAIGFGSVEDLTDGPALGERLDELIAGAAAIAGRASRVVDGHGAARVRNAMRHPELLVRPAESVADSDLLFTWANDPVTRQNSLSPRAIVREEHDAWFARKTRDTATLLLIAELEGVPVGQVRFDGIGAPEALVSISIAPSHRGGLGTKVLDAAVDEVFATTEVRSLLAQIKPENVASRRAFEKAGFRVVEPARVNDVEVIQVRREAA